MKKAVIAGASGLTGGLLLNILLKSPEYQEVLALVRKPLPVTNAKLKQLEIDFDRMDDYAVEITGDVFFCTLGTTRKKTPDMAIYRRIDHDYPVILAQIARKNGAAQYHLISSLGADKTAKSFYLKFKGETEQDVINAGLPCTHIYRPSFIVGNRKEHRPMEHFLVKVMKLLDQLLIGPLKKYRSIPASAIAMAMYKQSLIQNKGVLVHPSHQIKQLS